jgi:UMF1 family MFS transporter
MYDWANSAYNLVITTTIFPIYYESITGDGNDNTTTDPVTFLGRHYVNTALYYYVLGAAFLLVAVMSPILTSIADYKGNKKAYLRFFCTIGSLACASLYFFAPQQTAAGEVGTLTSSALNIGIIGMFMACIGYWGSNVFYNSYLPDLVPEELRDRTSARGFAYGYLGSVLLQIVCFLFVFFPGILGLESKFEQSIMPARVSFLLVALWWFGFAQITLQFLPTIPLKERKERKNVIINGFSELKKVWDQVKKLPVLKRFLFSFFWYSAGIQTVFLAATPFAAKEIHLSTTELIISMLITQLVAILGAIVISRASERFGNFKTLIATVTVWALVCVYAYFVTTDVGFYIIAFTVGLVMGGIQSLGRSTYSKLMPETKDTASFFSFYDVTEKIALVIGIITFGFLEEFTGSMRNSILSLIGFFTISLLLLFYTLMTQKKIQRQQQTKPGV